ncbi:Uncharacterised protein [Mycobacteroides abscessus subsp. abscessus]|nr:Uncharacterised protein [Mycobacteroides abscessus subsp. abscessus]SHY63989.1 Uncharacterised protein [Mycobacteroides abscessus subsp. abscessus]SIC12144.1 Uncharacterised protein [Mycobacteroides abscessus subsp. abscessus]SIC28996.1 Uncharacterised protein [Mycobacteroides abscessus subsp. abscessus]SIC65807.1 Uncharacterised protein [Mycobacteroides abscessus subsp. abscessus]
MMSPRDQIREAMQRLLSGTAQYTDGRLTRTNLALEAGVARATLYRHPDLIAEWACRMTKSEATQAPASHEATIARLTRQLDQERQLRRQSERICDALALVVADLYRQLQNRNDSSTNPVVQINPASRSSRRATDT